MDDNTGPRCGFSVETAAGQAAVQEQKLASTKRIFLTKFTPNFYPFLKCSSCQEVISRGYTFPFCFLYFCSSPASNSHCMHLCAQTCPESRAVERVRTALRGTCHLLNIHSSNILFNKYTINMKEYRHIFRSMI